MGLPETFLPIEPMSTDITHDVQVNMLSLRQTRKTKVPFVADPPRNWLPAQETIINDHALETSQVAGGPLLRVQRRDGKPAIYALWMIRHWRMQHALLADAFVDEP